mmetsp:Transcript_28633/g.60193  ORF Transcript_28633/g.60193 Transcript_28633/m.60193 type:complete len:797 (+) Transcript_28633:332-2722(+)
MDRKNDFAQQLASLQKAASRAGTASTTPTGGAAASSNPTNTTDSYYSTAANTNSRDGSNSSNHNRFGSPPRFNNYRGGRSSDGGNGGRSDHYGRGSGGRGRGHSRDGRDGREDRDNLHSSRDREDSYNSRDRDRERPGNSNERSERYDPDRKRRRYDDRDYNSNRDTRSGGRGGGYHGRSVGRGGRFDGTRGDGGGRWNYNDRTRDSRGNSTAATVNATPGKDDRERSGASPAGSAPYVPLADLVTLVREKRAGSCISISTESTTEGTPAKDVANATISGTNTPSTPSNDTKPKRSHIALLFLTITDLPHEHVWKAWLKSSKYFKDDLGDERENNVTNGGNQIGNGKGNEEMDEATAPPLVSIIFHAKYPERIKSPWVKQRHLIRLPLHILNGETEDKERDNRDEGRDSDRVSTNPSSTMPATSERQRGNSAAETMNNNDDNNSGINGGSTNKMPMSSFAPKFHSRRPEWGSLEITRGMIDLLDEGLRIGNTSAPVARKGEKEDLRCAYRRYLSTPGDILPEKSALASSGNGAGKDGEAKSAQYVPRITSDRDIPPVDRFIFVSESCLPVATLDEVELALFGPRKTIGNDASENHKGDECNKKDVQSLYNKSWINARSTPNNGYSRQLQWDEIRPTDIPQNLIWKADQWIVLTRSHGEAVTSMPSKYLNGRYLWTAFRNCRASDEMYFPTALSILGILQRGGNDKEVDDSSKGESCAGKEIRRRKITYCDWSMGAKNPVAYTLKDWKEVAEKARNEGCLFARKFVPQRGKMKSGSTGNGIISAREWVDTIVGIGGK